MTIRTYIGLGSNLGDSQQILSEAVAKLAVLGSVKVSQLYQSPPMGPQDQPNYLNAVVQLDTSLEPLALLDQLQQFEQDAGRVRSARGANERLILIYSYMGNNKYKLSV